MVTAHFALDYSLSLRSSWTWQSGSNPPDPGLSGLRGSFQAIDWSGEEKQENTLPRGFVQAIDNRHLLSNRTAHHFYGRWGRQCVRNRTQNDVFGQSASSPNHIKSIYPFLFNVACTCSIGNKNPFMAFDAGAIDRGETCEL
jgi:hypothetical protein